MLTTVASLASIQAGPHGSFKRDGHDRNSAHPDPRKEGRRLGGGDEVASRLMRTNRSELPHGLTAAGQSRWRFWKALDG